MSFFASTSRSLHDLGLSAWFGGSLVGAVGLNPAASDASTPEDRPRLATDGWARSAPFFAAAIGAHVVGGLGVIASNRKRIGAQQGVGSATLYKTVLTGAALGATAYAGWLGAQTAAAVDVPSEGATTPSESTPPEVASAQKQLKILQYAIPALTGLLVISSAKMGEQQRPGNVADGVLAKAASLAPAPSQAID